MSIFQSPQMQSINPIAIISMLVVWIGLIIFSFLTMRKRALNKNKIMVLLGISIIMSGFVLGAFPNPVAPFQQIFTGIRTNTIIQILPMIFIIFGLIITTLFFGRQFCAYACPFGALQELLSKWRFPNSFKSGKKDKKIKILQISPKLSKSIRWIMFANFFLGTIVWSIAILQIINPFTAFQIFRVPQITAIIIPLITFGVIVVLSVFIYRPWCTFMCPFGAIAGETAKISRNKLRRTNGCTDCHLCERICPTSEAKRDSNKGECYLCNRCVEICPQNAIIMEKKQIN